MSFKSLILKGARNGLGLIIVFFDLISRPKGMQRTEAEQANAQSAMSGSVFVSIFRVPFLYQNPARYP